MEIKTGTIVKVSGPLVVASGMTGSRMYDMVRVSEKKLLGEIIQLHGDEAAIQVYEETAGIGPGEPVYPTYEPLSVELGPGLLETIYDGVQRPLDLIQERAGYFITRGIDVPALNREKRWHFVPLVKEGDSVGQGDVLGEVQETVLVKHRIMVPRGISGRVVKIAAGDYRVIDTVAVVQTETGEKRLTMVQRWPVRQPRPVRKKLPPQYPLVTGQLAKWSDADIVIFVGCGERGNEMTDVLMEFPQLKDPRSGEPLMKRTVLIANTSNMPVAAREASVYTAITIGEYFRDMGYSVALQADSTSRWAEAMREISGRLEEMPGEEGYPAYLATRIAEFYERAGRVVCLGRYQGKDVEGALTVIGSVSPPGGDLNDPVVQATLRVVKVFWSLEDKLAFQRHFPAISWLRSYSLYRDATAEAIAKLAGTEFPDNTRRALSLLQKEAELEEIVRLVGKDTLSPEDRLILETARSVREDFLHQNAFHDVDTYTSFKKQAAMLGVILLFYELAQKALEQGADIDEIERLPVRERIARLKFFTEDELLDAVKSIEQQLAEEMSRLVGASQGVFASRTRGREEKEEQV